MSARQFHPPVEWERFAFAFAAVVTFASAACTLFADARGLANLADLFVGFAPLYALSLILASVGMMLRRKRLKNMRDHDALVSRLLEGRN